MPQDKQLLVLIFHSSSIKKKGLQRGIKRVPLRPQTWTDCRKTDWNACLIQPAVLMQVGANYCKNCGKWSHPTEIRPTIKHILRTSLLKFLSQFSWWCDSPQAIWSQTHGELGGTFSWRTGTCYHMARWGWGPCPCTWAHKPSREKTGEKERGETLYG